jgi:hypothetical protein
MIASRFGAVLGALSLSLLMLGCGNGRLHILIPDFIASSVDGLRLFRVVADGGLQAAGRVVFGPVTTTSTGQQMEYTQIVPGQATWGPLMARMTRPASGQVELEMVLFNAGAPAFFRFASYNENGASPITDGQVYVGASR